MRALLAGVILCGCGASFEYRGFTAADGRAFPFRPIQRDQSWGNAVSLVAEPEVSLASGDGSHVATVRPFLRLDPIDRQRSHWDVRRADYVLSAGSFELGLGAGIFRWGVLESYSAVDVINQADYLEDLDRSEKVGQPYASIGYLPGDFAVRAYVLPYFRAARFPGENGRLRLGGVVDTGERIFETPLAEWQPSFALRVSGAIGEVDLGLGFFSGVSREPRFVAQLTEPTVVAAYDLAHQASIDLQWTHGPFALKLEALGRLWSLERRFFFAAGGGLEYTFFDIGGSGIDLSLAAEYLFDGRPIEAPVTFFQNDVFLGFRIAFNDTDGTQIFGGGITDVTDLRSYLRLGADRRLGDHFKLALELNAFLGNRKGLESALLADHYAQLRIAYFF
jgi:hypothetical protein